MQVGRTYGLDVQPDAKVEDLGVGDRQRVEIVKVLFRGARIIILDEPTAVLVPHEVSELAQNLRRLATEGHAIILIDHKLDEVLSIADRVTVMRAGRSVTTVSAASITARDLAEMMVGGELPTPDTPPRAGTSEPVLRLVGLTVLGDDDRPRVQDIDLVVERGQILGVAGVEGNGQSELIAAVLGIREVAGGSIVFGDEDITHASTRARRSSGMGYIPEDRQRRGLLLDATLWENTMLGHQASPPFSKGLFIDRKAAWRRAEELIRDHDVKAPGPSTAAHALSGGNQQKLIVARELAAEPRLLIAGHPTRGIDVGAQAAIWDRLRNARAEGLAVLLVSADLDELLGLSDDLVVMLRGRIVARLNPATVDAATLGSYMTGAQSAQGAPA
jgi:simple sugar transport system ATP-binding protein